MGFVRNVRRNLGMCAEFSFLSKKTRMCDDNSHMRRCCVFFFVFLGWQLWCPDAKIFFLCTDQFDKILEEDHIKAKMKREK